MNSRIFHLRKEAHDAFDPLWKSGLRSRRGAYQILMDILKLPENKAHISMLDEEQCLLLIKRLEMGEYWISAGKKLNPKRKIWVRDPKKGTKFIDLFKMRRKIRVVYQNAMRGMRIFGRRGLHAPCPWRMPIY